MNDTKWDELRQAMHGLDGLTPRWRTRDMETGHVSEWDREWFYHFRNGAHKFIEWVEIAVDTGEQRSAVLAALVRIHVPGEPTKSGYRIFGHMKTGKVVDYIDGEDPVNGRDSGGTGLSRRRWFFSLATC